LNWTDPDGSIERYEFMGRIFKTFSYELNFLIKKKLATYSGNSNPIALNYNRNGDLFIQLPQGPAYDSYKLYLFVNIIDDTYGTIVYNITQPVTVMPDNNFASFITATDPNSPFFQDLNSENLNIVAKNVIALSSVFNIQSLSASSSATSSSLNTTNATNADNDQKAQIREYLIGKLVDLSVSHMSSIKVMSSALASASANTEQISRNSAVRFFKNNFFNFYILSSY
jgi:hypothetical protein